MDTVVVKKRFSALGRARGRGTVSTRRYSTAEPRGNSLISQMGMARATSMGHDAEMLCIGWKLSCINQYILYKFQLYNMYSTCKA